MHLSLMILCELVSGSGFHIDPFTRTTPMWAPCSGSFLVWSRVRGRFLETPNGKICHS